MSAAKLIFAGTPEFALASLRALVDGGYVPAAVMTQPDRPAGRGRKLVASPVKEYGVDCDIPIWQPATLRDADIVQTIADAKPDLIVVAAYGLLLPQVVLDLPRTGCLNVHASLLPRWRGAAPVQAAILAGDDETGISLMRMEAGLDTGPVYASTAMQIAPTESAGELHDRLAALGGELLLGHLEEIISGDLEPEPQDEDAATYAGKIRKQDAQLNFDDPALSMLRKIRAYNPTPGASFKFGDEIIKCWRAEEARGMEGHAGTVLAAGSDGIDVACGEGAIRMLEVQRPGRRHITAREFAGQSALVGKRFV